MNSIPKKGCLYIVPTPIGNLSDITVRAKNMLEECDFVAAEDTRVSGKLLMLLGIKKPLVSYHEHNKAYAGKKICDRILSGQVCAIVTDAGTPAISDPGTELVSLCAEKNINVIALPGACAAITALSGSGLPSRRFCFEGFLPDNKNERIEYLSSAKDEVRTLIYYIAPHDLEKTVTELYEYFGDRKCVLAKELTKLNERYLYTTLGKLPEQLKKAEPSFKKGEFVLVLEGSSAKNDNDWADISVEEHLLRYIKLGVKKMDACKLVAKERGISKASVYKIATEMKELDYKK